MLTSCKRTIYITGFNGFPYGYAPIKRISHLSKIFSQLDFIVIFVNINSTHKCIENEFIKRIGHFKDLIYLYLTNSPFKSKNFFLRNISKLTAPIREVLFYIKSLKKSKDNYIMLYSRNNFFHLLRLWLLGKIFNYKIICSIVEIYGYDGRGNGFIRKLNDFLFNKYVPAISNGLVIISHFIEKKLQLNPQYCKYLIIPPLVDINLFTDENYLSSLKNNYFLYCGTIDYKELVLFIIDSFYEINYCKKHLILVLSGKNSDNYLLIKEKIVSYKIENSVQIISNVSESELISLYRNSLALLIPFRPTIQDKARFPQKISEYLASSRPIITNENGEIQLYFTNNENAIIVEGFEVSYYAIKMHYVLLNSQEAKRIGENGFKLANEVFDYHNWITKMKCFLESLGNENSKKYTT